MMGAIRDLILAEKHQYQGEVDPRFLGLADTFNRLQNGRNQFGGAALVVYFQGHKVVDIYTGKKSRQEDWQPDTLSICYSTGKGVIATLAHILVSKGFLDYHTPVKQYWPEFGQNNKKNITLAHILSHQTGLYDIRNMIDTAVEMADWAHMLQVMEKSTPRFDVGSASAYQAITFGWLVGGVLEKATQRPLVELMQQYLVEPLALDGAYFGVPQDQISRVARPFKKEKSVSNAPNNASDNVLNNPRQNQAVKSNKAQTKNKQSSSIVGKLIKFTGQNPQDFLDAMAPRKMKEMSFLSDAGIQAVIPAANGAFTARSLAKMYAMMANKGQWGGETYIRPEIFQTLSEIQSHKRDRVMPIPMKWRLGYHRILSMGKRSKSGFGHIGYNGSGAWCDPDRELSFAYTHNFEIGSITGDYRLWGLTQEAIRCADGALTGHKGWF